MGEMESLVERITSDPSFAEQLRTDPQEALRSMGIEPTPDVLTAVSEGGSGEELAARISKRARYGG